VQAQQVELPAKPEQPAAPLVAPNMPGGPDYRIGPDDQLAIAVLQAPELNTTTRVSEQGAISMPLLGAVRAGGLTLPGILQVRGSTTLLQVLSLAGGLSDAAGDTLVVLRRNGNVPLPPLEVKLKPLMESRDPSLNLAVYPGDVVNVRGAEIVYVVGAVKKPGAFAMRGNDKLTVLRALALGEGLTPTAALVVRAGQDGRRQEIPVDLTALLKGKVQDVTLEAHDILFVPTSGSKVAARTTLDAFIRIVSWRPY
jgi:polysaccharide export outer membrane protein